jgi:hypothetical protein
MVKPKRNDNTKIRVCKARVENKPHFGNVLPCGLYITSKLMQPSYRGGGYVFFIKPTMKTKHLLTRQRKQLPYNMASSYNAKIPRDFKVLMNSKH